VNNKPGFALVILGFFETTDPFAAARPGFLEGLAKAFR